MSTQSGSYTTYPKGYDSTYSSYASASDISNGYNLSSNSTYATITCNTGSNATSYISYTFDWSSVPSNATITGVYGWVKLRVSNVTNLPSTALAFYAGSTRKSSTKGFSTTSTYNSVEFSTSDMGSWTRSEVTNMMVRATAQRGTANTSTASYIYFYGATVTVSYTYENYEFTVTNTSPAVVEYSDNSSGGVNYGTTYRLNLVASSLTGVTVIDNNVDVTSSIQDSFYTHEYLYTIPAVAENHTISISGGTAVEQYDITVTNSSEQEFDYLGTDQSYFFAGDTVVIWIIGGNLAAIALKDNGVDVTSQIQTSSDEYGSYSYYQLSNINSDHTIIAYDAGGEAIPIWVKQNGTWNAVSKVYVKQSGSWSEATVMIKTNGSWN